MTPTAPPALGPLCAALVAQLDRVQRTLARFGGALDPTAPKRLPGRLHPGDIGGASGRAATAGGPTRGVGGRPGTSEAAIIRTYRLRAREGRWHRIRHTIGVSVATVGLSALLMLALLSLCLAALWLGPP
jgi:hypothetical protein